MRTVFHIENRGSDFIYHWLCFMVAGFRHFETGMSRRGPDGSGCIERNAPRDATTIPPPFNVWIPSIRNIYTFQKETFDIISDRYMLVPREEVVPTDVIINNYGELINTDNLPHPDAYIFLRKLFLDRLPRKESSVHRGKKYFISRARASGLPGNDGLARRTIVNESNVIAALSSRGFEAIFLEDYSLREKVEIFQEAATIASPGSSALLFSLFSGPEQRILETNVADPHQISHQYSTICRLNGVPYARFASSKVDSNDNMHVNVEGFVAALTQLEEGR